MTLNLFWPDDDGRSPQQNPADISVFRNPMNGIFFDPGRWKRVPWDRSWLYAPPLYKFRHEPATAFEALFWLASNAAWKDGITRQAQPSPVVLQRGQAGLSLVEIASALQWTGEQTRKFLGRLEECGIIQINEDVHPSGILVISIVGYDDINFLDEKDPRVYPPYLGWPRRVTAFKGRGWSRSLPQEVRQRVLDSADGKCVYCGTPIDGDKRHRFQTDHKIPRSLGGSDNPSNLVAACATCNGRKGTKSAVAFAKRKRNDGTRSASE